MEANVKKTCQEVSFRAGVSRKYFKREWRPVLEIIHRYVTWEGRLSSAYVYHLRLMTVFLGQPINLPHYLVQSMTKMSTAIKKGPKNVGRSIFHHGLIRILVEMELSKWNQTWDRFLEQNGFMAFYHCQFDCPDEYSWHQQPCETATPPAHNPLPNPNAHVNPSIHKNCAPAPL